MQPVEKSLQGGLTDNDLRCIEEHVKIYSMLAIYCTCAENVQYPHNVDNKLGSGALI